MRNNVILDARDPTPAKDTIREKPPRQAATFEHLAIIMAQACKIKTEVPGRFLTNGISGRRRISRIDNHTVSLILSAMYLYVREYLCPRPLW